MSILTIPELLEEVHYPESDGKPIADNTRQFDYISYIKWGVDNLFRHDPYVFVAGDLLWYPVEGDSSVCAAPDTMVVFGRPRGDRRSYIQFREAGISPQVVFEVLSHKNDSSEMDRKFEFYQRYGVEEYYVYDPERGGLTGWVREGAILQPIPGMEGWVSPRLGTRFSLLDGEMRLFNPDGTPFASYFDLVDQRDEERQRAEKERQRAERLAARLRELGIDPDA